MDQPLRQDRHWMDVPAEGASELQLRLKAVWDAMQSGPKGARHVDLFALVRHWGLWRSALGDDRWWPMPFVAPWPDAEAWREAGFDAYESAMALEVRAQPVLLPWLGAQADLLSDAFKGLPSRRDLTVRADPVVQRRLGVTSYTGMGQREALRALIQLPADVALIANLPTGSGKSLLAQMPPLLEGAGHVSLVIVPTVALAIDQARRMAELLQRLDGSWQPTPLAYHGGLKREERAKVHRAIRDGTQRALFTSPESATGVLRDSLEFAAKAGRLTHVIVDEAHLVATWGQGFRPEFQLLPALVRHLRDLSRGAGRSIRLVLASGTLSPPTVSTLQKLFGPASNTQVVSAVHLRPEPRYAIHHCAHETERRQLVVEVLKRAPRPFILYVTRPDIASEFEDLLRDNGFGRIERFTGDTGPSEREYLLKEWAHNRIDGMVATSAFGLGVDKADVRTIVHATLPESLDRFYQEVGRSGRDGRASASLLLFTNADIKAATEMAGNSLISNDLAFERWENMIAHPVSQDLERSLVWVDLRRKRAEISVDSPTNRDWNLRTLNLMTSAGLLELEGLRSKPPEVLEDLADVETVAEPLYAAVGIRDLRHRQRTHFDTRMDAARKVSFRASDLGVSTMVRVARGQEEISKALSKLYTLNQTNAFAPVSSCCGGCAEHWPVRADSTYYSPPQVYRIDRFDPRPVSRRPFNIDGIGGGRTHLLTHRHAHARAPGYVALVSALISQLNPHTVIAAKAGDWFDVAMERVHALNMATFVDILDERRASSLDGGQGEVRIVMWPSRPITLKERDALLHSPSALTVLLIPADLSDPSRPDRAWAGVMPHIREAQVLEEFNR
ncbi:protein DpdF [Variovorax robiniae]|uniref:DNA 3'-5' helicase n=1 Tax=Variovorax robiniae TaxID=1836199 RepID=A0ABU8XM01_9BURK